jgi:putative transposase
MPWLETDPMSERLKFVQDALGDRFTMAEVCARYGVSRPTGYKRIARYEVRGGAGGATGAARRTRARTSSPRG